MPSSLSYADLGSPPAGLSADGLLSLHGYRSFPPEEHERQPAKVWKPLYAAPYPKQYGVPQLIGGLWVDPPPSRSPRSPRPDVQEDLAYLASFTEELRAASPAPDDEAEAPETEPDYTVWKDVARPYLDGLLRSIRQDANPPISDFTVPNDASAFDANYRALDLVLNPRSGYCVLGKGWLILDRKDRRYRSQRLRCLGGKCPHCIDYWLHNTIRRALKHRLDLTAIYHSVFPNLEAFTRRVAGQRLKEQYPDSWFWVREPDGTLHVFTPGPPTDYPAERCEDPVAALLDALLRTKAYPGKGNARHSQLPREERELDPDKRHVPLARHQSPESANRDLQARLGRSIDWDAAKKVGYRNQSFSVRYDVELADEELDLADEVLDRHLGLSQEEFEEMIDMQRIRREGQRILDSLPADFLRRINPDP